MAAAVLTLVRAVAAGERVKHVADRRPQVTFGGVARAVGQAVDLRFVQGHTFAGDCGRAVRSARPLCRRVLRGLDGDSGGPGLLGLGDAHGQDAVLVASARAGRGGAHRQGDAAVETARAPLTDVIAAAVGRLGL